MGGVGKCVMCGWSGEVCDVWVEWGSVGGVVKCVMCGWSGDVCEVGRCVMCAGYSYVIIIIQCV